MINIKTAEKIRQAQERDLFENIISDPGPSIKAAIKEVVRRSSLSREQIIDAMNSLMAIAGITTNGRSQKMTKDVLNKWTAPGAKSHIPSLQLLCIFCRATGDNLPLSAYSKFFEGVRAISDEDYKKLLWAEAEIDARRARKRAGQLAPEVGLK